MCGRYLLRECPPDSVHDPWSQFIDNIRLDAPRNNVAPSQDGLVLRQVDGVIQVEKMTWGFRPSWIKQKSKSQINSRCETVFEKTMFKREILSKRCIVICNGFYEPKGYTQPKPWYCIRYPDFRYIALAGIWTIFKGEEEEYSNYSILTKQSNQLLEAVHQRMPVILPSSDFEMWLDPSNKNPQLISQAFSQTEFAEMICHPVSDFVKKAGNEGDECVRDISVTS